MEIYYWCLNYDNIELITNFAAQYNEELVDGQIVFTAFIAEIGDLNEFFGHIEYDANFDVYTDKFENGPQIGQRADFKIGRIKFVNGAVADY